MLFKKLFLVLTASALGTGCSSAPDEPRELSTSGAASSGPAPSQRDTVCLMTDVKGNFDDRTYIATAFKGVEQVKSTLGWRAITVEPQTSTKEAFRDELTELLTQGCNLVVAVSPLFGDVTDEVAQANPTQLFQALDHVPAPPLDNVWGQGYAVSEATFLAGYVAAAVTTTGKVGTFGGLNIPPITEFLDGFALGVEHYNQVHGDSVEVLGWDLLGRVGLFTESFVDIMKGQEVANQLLDQGADILFPVAGGASYGAGDAVIVRGNAYVIGVDLDWAEQEGYADVTLTSVLKKLDKSVLSAVNAVIDGSFEGGTRMGTLANGEVDIAPFHQLESIVPDEVKAQLPMIRAQIIDGSLPTKR